MSIEKGKVITAIETKYKGKGLSKTFINGVAVKIADALEAEEDIEGRLEELDFMFTTAISEADRRVTDAVNKLKKPVQGEPKKEDEPVVEEDDAEPMPKWAKMFAKSLETIGTQVSAIQQEKVQTTIKDRFLSDERLKGIPAVLLKGRVPSKEEDLESYIEEAAEELKEYVKADDGFEAGASGSGITKKTDKPGFSGSDRKPATPTKATADATKKTIDSVVDSII